VQAVSSKQRRGRNKSTQWRQIASARTHRERSGELPVWDRRRYEKKIVARYFFYPVEQHARAFEFIAQAGHTGEYQTKAAQSAGELLAAWHAIQELPKQTRKPWEIVHKLAISYLTNLRLFIEFERDISNKFQLSIYRDNDPMDKFELKKKVGVFMGDPAILWRFWNHFYEATQTRAPTVD
jgi:hypothetical protein